MEAVTLLLILLVLACPVSMLWMMRNRRRMHGMHGDDRPDEGTSPDPEARLAELEARQAATARDITALRARPRADRRPRLDSTPER